MTLHVSVHFYLQLVLCSLAIRNQENYFTKLRLKKIQFLQRVSIEMFSQSPTLPYRVWGVCDCEVSMSRLSPSLSVGHLQPRPHHLPHPPQLQLSHLARVKRKVGTKNGGCGRNQSDDNNSINITEKYCIISQLQVYYVMFTSCQGKSKYS